MKNNVAIVSGFSTTTNWARTTSDTTSLDGNNVRRVLYNRTELHNNTALLYRVKITRGNNAFSGGGMYNNGLSPSLNNVTFSKNTASNGGVCIIILPSYLNQYHFLQ